MNAWRYSIGEWHCYGPDKWSLCGFFELSRKPKPGGRIPPKDEACGKCWVEYQKQISTGGPVESGQQPTAGGGG